MLKKNKNLNIFYCKDFFTYTNKLFLLQFLLKVYFSDDPNLCQAAPFWNEVPPGDIQGSINCGTLANNEEEYPVGHVCTYSCPAGKTFYNSNIQRRAEFAATNLNETNGNKLSTSTILF